MLTLSLVIRVCCVLCKPLLNPRKQQKTAQNEEHASDRTPRQALFGRSLQLGARIQRLAGLHRTGAHLQVQIIARLNASVSQLRLEDRRQSLLDHCGSKLTQSKCFSMAERINYVHKVHLCNKEVTIGGGSIAEDDEARESLSSQVVPKQSAPFHSTASTNDLRSLSPINNISDDSVFTDGDLSENNGDDVVPTRLTRSSTAICNEPFRFVETEDDDNEADRTLDCIDRLRERNLARDDEFDDGHMPFLGYTNTPLS